ncbi:MAG: hydroxyacylglutathione hydrolase [Hyphomicrobiales bacterium]|jgi:hydroxyacylglutathione hydrolase
MQALKVTVVPVTPFAQNCSIVACTATDLAAIVDPGGDLPRIMEAIAQLGVTPEKILLTHGHIDHAGAAADLADALSVPIEGPHEADAFLLAGLVEQGKRFGITEARNVTPTRWFAEGDSVTIGKLRFDVLHVPGHTPGHLVFVAARERFALVGDTLFAGSVGRTDFPYGSHDQLIAGIKTKLLPLGDDVTILPGHGPASTIGAERSGNGFLQS